ncbi:MULTISPECIES: hypothetical protein [unclassified Amycolatopsis]|uniref:hypothetical protein n=1 Tax=unclassified Amycolatopsis TaxID=2618356 RepID=UPI002874FE49|nr:MULTISPECIES: hypothetical protein [unclassified Amycolatopsis]MDS0132537.1 hypothetical protein [Amycolatopsis sp. 505]MDS0142638.1 hypothetical protein [Amycolatopsis sp. CM201R]
MPEVYDPSGDWELPGPNGVPRAGSYGPAGGASGGAGFAYDEETLRELMREWNDLADEFKHDQEQATTLTRVKGPGLEYASGGNAEKIHQSGEALLSTLAAREEYCRNMAAKFQTALGKYARTEDDHTTEIKQTGGSL